MNVHGSNESGFAFWNRKVAKEDRVGLLRFTMVLPRSGPVPASFVPPDSCAVATTASFSFQTVLSQKEKMGA